MNRYRPVSRSVPRRHPEQPYLFEGMKQHYYGFDVRVAVGEFFERVAQAIYGGTQPSTFRTIYNIDICPDLNGGPIWFEIKGQKTSERLMLRHLQLWRYMMLMSKEPHKRFYYVVCRYRPAQPLKTYGGDKEAMQEALGFGLKLVIRLPFSVLFRIAMLPDNRRHIYRHQLFEEEHNRYYMNSWVQCGRMRELADQGISFLKQFGLDHDQYKEFRFRCRLNETEDFEILHVHEKRPLGAQRDLLAQYGGDLDMFIDIENGIFDKSQGVEDDGTFAGDDTEPEPELGLEVEDEVPF